MVPKFIEFLSDSSVTTCLDKNTIENNHNNSNDHSLTLSSSQLTSVLGKNKKIDWNDLFEKIGNFIIVELATITNFDNKFMQLRSLLTSYLNNVNTSKD